QGRRVYRRRRDARPVILEHEQRGEIKRRRGVVAVPVGGGRGQGNETAAGEAPRLVGVVRGGVHDGALLVERYLAVRVHAHRKHNIARGGVGGVRALAADDLAAFEEQEHRVVARGIGQTRGAPGCRERVADGRGRGRPIRPKNRGELGRKTRRRVCRENGLV